MTMGRNTPSGAQLNSFVERVERIRKDKEVLRDDEGAVMAEAKAAGFVPAILRYVIGRRAKKPHDLQEAESIADTYMAALGMATDTPLFRHVASMSVDIAQRESVIEALKALVPAVGSITIDAGGGRPVKLTREKDGSVAVEEVQPRAEPKPPGSPKGAPPSRPEPPDVDAAGAERLGREAFQANLPIIANPFPFGDARRPRWDRGWRDESGGDGMGPED